MAEIKSMQKSPEGPSGFEPLKISSLRLCRRSLTFKGQGGEMKKSIWILCLALTIAGFFAFCKTVYAAPKFKSGSSTLTHPYMPGRLGDELNAALTFGSDSSTLTHPYLPARLGDKLTYRSYGWPSVYYRDDEVVAEEIVDQVKCLKTKSSESGFIEYSWLAQDTSGNIWMLQYQEEGYTTTYGRDGAILVMPYQVGVGSILWGDETVVATGVYVPQLSTGFGPYNNCIKSMYDWGDGDIDYYYYAPGVGEVKEEWNDDGGINGYEISSVTRGYNSLIGVFRPSTGTWYLDLNGNHAWDGCGTDGCGYFGMNGDLPVAGDWNNDGVSEVGTFRPGTGMWYLDLNGNDQWSGCGTDSCIHFGMSGDLPVAGDWNNSGPAKVGVFRPTTGMWYLDYNGNGQWDGCGTDSCIHFGMSGDLPVAGDWDGSGSGKVGVFRPSTGWWYLDYNGNGQWDGCGTDRCINFGMSGDQPVSGDWDGSGTAKVGVFRPSTGRWYVDLNGNGQWDGCSVDGCYYFGTAGDIAVTGSW
jgi:hypothetical protein